MGVTSKFKLCSECGELSLRKVPATNMWVCDNCEVSHPVHRRDIERTIETLMDVLDKMVFVDRVLQIQCGLNNSLLDSVSETLEKLRSEWNNE